GLWRLLLGRCHKLEDTDFFLSFLIDYFFGDYRLAGLISAPILRPLSSDDLETFTAAIGYYIFSQRLDDLVANIDRHVAQYERFALRFAPGAIDVPADGHPDYHSFDPQRAMQLQMGMSFGALRSRHTMWP